MIKALQDLIQNEAGLLSAFLVNDSITLLGIPLVILYPRELVVLDLLSINANDAYNPKSISWTQKAPMLTA
ncbi:MAG TPA: hypothetical protein VE223_03005 [Nitrososphaeraceae archaeon]|jgi:hypothetical protein|nr:hypothetical protein [Nitrososphaeraceae archaeon]